MEVKPHVKIDDKASTPLEEWRKQNPYPTALPDDLSKQFIGLTSMQAKKLYSNVRIYTRNAILTADLQYNRLNLICINKICNDGIAHIIVEVAGFF